MPLPFKTCWMLGSLAISLFGLLWLGAYEGTPASPPSGEPTWPDNSQLELAVGQPTVLMFVHPKCPCTVASAEQLLEVLRSRHTRGTLICSVPTGATHDWMQGPLLRLAAAHSQHVQVVFDVDGELAQRFQVTTSGTCLVYGPDGQRRFTGGLTLSRGHRGANAGMEAIARSLDDPDQRFELATFPVFGCSLVGAPSAPQ